MIRVRLASPANDGQLTPHLPEGVPYGLVGSSSLYKRESYPDGVVPPGKVTAGYPASKSGSSSNDAFRNLGGVYSTGRNWLRQGADAGLYDNSDIHAIRIVITEPVTSTGAKGLFRGHATNFQDLRPESAPFCAISALAPALSWPALMVTLRSETAPRS